MSAGIGCPGEDRNLALEAAGRFEALLLGTLLRAGTRPIGGKALLDGGSAGRMYREMLFEELARKATLQGGFGLKQLIERSAGSDAASEETR